MKFFRKMSARSRSPLHHCSTVMLRYWVTKLRFPQNQTSAIAQLPLTNSTNLPRSFNCHVNSSRWARSRGFDDKNANQGWRKRTSSHKKVRSPELCSARSSSSVSRLAVYFVNFFHMTQLLNRNDTVMAIAQQGTNCQWKSEYVKHRGKINEWCKHQGRGVGGFWVEPDS